LVRPHVSLLDGPAVARFLPKAGIYNAIFAVDPDYARHAAWKHLLNAYGRLTGGHTMLPLDATRPFAMRELLRNLQSGRDVVIFPQGTGIGDSARPDARGCDWLLEKTSGEARTSRCVMEITLSHETRWPRIERFDELLPYRGPAVGNGVMRGRERKARPCRVQPLVRPPVSGERPD
ncbi:phospholipid/glycerol acyltransferase, partial [Acidithiobacillus sp. GGI-221]